MITRKEGVEFKAVIETNQLFIDSFLLIGYSVQGTVNFLCLHGRGLDRLFQDGWNYCSK